ncbi:hypothetical protein HNQ44_002567 [Planomicrobium koreense]|uniref:Transcriptional coactivator p15 (PC4) C-terminal domain-containing protein n=1 Tax=Planococcus koreensis TaxID=112331 RepID=A0A7W8FVQ3_9BACL|nr:PC4/YdbC family ssDNA-binding protein [Planococcus koreensis]MBB5181102.1 hypothetical protein [Planococcus koreensis]
MADLKFEIIETIGTLSTKQNGWKKQLTLISWTNRDPKYDIRFWSEDQTEMKKGITFDLSELQTLKGLLNQMPELK